MERGSKGASGDRIGVVVIGRNEGARLKACLRSLAGCGTIVYVDSGSTDDSVAFARSCGVDVVELSTESGFTAARARNAGLAALAPADPEFVQMVDGDCEVDGGWLAAAHAALIAESDLAVVFGRRRERHPEASIYNRLCDAEWDVPSGDARSCGGDALFRMAPLIVTGGYNGDIIAGEEPDLCLRLRKAGWRVRRIDAEMTRHDAAMTRFGQWWRRSKRSGHAFAELNFRHGAQGDPRWRGQVRSIAIWGGILPAIVGALLVGSLVLPVSAWIAVAGCLPYPLQIARLAWRQWWGGSPLGFAVASAFFLQLGKFPQLAGMIRFHRDRSTARAPAIIEYKGPVVTP